MLRAATPDDFDFIYKLIIAEAKQGHFHKSLLSLLPRLCFKRNLKSVFKDFANLYGLPARAYIWEKDNMRIGFIILSVWWKDERTIELWLSAIAPTYRGYGEGKKMILHLVNQIENLVNGNTVGFVARCLPRSQIMFHILNKLGFVLGHIEDGTGLRYLEYKL